jgi:hypothetical protein
VLILSPYFLVAWVCGDCTITGAKAWIKYRRRRYDDLPAWKRGCISLLQLMLLVGILDLVSRI